MQCKNSPRRRNVNAAERPAVPPCPRDHGGNAPVGAAVWCARDAGFQFGAGEGEGQRTKPASKMARRPPIAKITGGEREIREQREWKGREGVVPLRTRRLMTKLPFADE